MNAKKKDRLLGLILLLISLFFFIFTMRQEAPRFEGDPGPKMFPLIGCVLTAACGILTLVHPEKKESKTYLTKEELKRAAKLFGLYAAFLLLIWGLGFLITAPVLLFAISVLFSYESRPDDPLAKRLLRSAIYAVIVGGALYLLYVTVLQTQLPTGALWKLFKK